MAQNSHMYPILRLQLYIHKWSPNLYLQSQCHLQFKWHISKKKILSSNIISHEGQIVLSTLSVLQHGCKPLSLCINWSSHFITSSLVPLYFAVWNALTHLTSKLHISHSSFISLTLSVNFPLIHFPCQIPILFTAYTTNLIPTIWSFLLLSFILYMGPLL